MDYNIFDKLTNIKVEEMCNMTISLVEEMINIIKEENLQDEQFALDFLDKLNELSVKF